MHVVALVESPEHVCCRYRVSAYRPHLEAAGHRLQLCPWPKRWWSRLRLAQALGDADLVLLQRRLLPLWMLYLVRCTARRLVFDFDDAIFLRDSYSPKGPHSAARLHRFMATVETADAVVAGNPYLAAEASRWVGGPGAYTWSRPASIRPVMFRPGMTTAGRGSRWCGSGRRAHCAA